MPQWKAIPPDFEPKILEKAGEGLSPAKIAAWLLTDHQVKVSGKTVYRYLQRVAEERRPIAQAIVGEKLRGSITADLNAVDGVLSRALSDEETARAAVLAQGERPALEAGSLEWARCMAVVDEAAVRALKAADLRLKLSGAGGNDGDAPSGVVLLPPESD